jgi:hypothetical protein
MMPPEDTETTPTDLRGLVLGMRDAVERMWAAELEHADCVRRVYAYEAGGGALEQMGRLAEAAVSQSILAMARASAIKAEMAVLRWAEESRDG